MICCRVREQARPGRILFSLLVLGTGGPERQPRECLVVSSKKRTVTVTKAVRELPAAPSWIRGGWMPGMVTAGNRYYLCGLSALCRGWWVGGWLYVPETDTSLPSAPSCSVSPSVFCSPRWHRLSIPSPHLCARVILGESETEFQAGVAWSEVLLPSVLRSNCRQAMSAVPSLGTRAMLALVPAHRRAVLPPHPLPHHC